MNESTNLPTVTFGIPVLNAEEFLDRCLSSIMSQDYPKDKLEVIIADGGSTDSTLEIARRHGATIVHNQKKLADFGIKLAAKQCGGEVLVIFAADNELGSKDWVRTIASAYRERPELACIWCDMVAGSDDPPINRYYEMIKSDPLMYSINKNLKDHYLATTHPERIGGHNFYFFKVEPSRPLVWGANGLSYRTDFVRHIIAVDEFVGDNDVFQIMVEEGHNLVGFSPTLKVLHHHLKSLSHWAAKWNRNYQQHMVAQLESRNMGWAIAGNFKAKAALWLIYSLIPVFSSVHAVCLAVKDRNRYWLYHPLASFMQASFLLRMTLGSKKGRTVLKGPGQQARKGEQTHDA
ncbi:glycosyltransferase family 2 protein [Nitrososphaera sp.]|uniref:glycosyltransferase n=1 Tax=Nitrososphaera sp. TaxID=1971748 RepID=UPI003172137A